MTAIVWAYGPEGFVIAADGRSVENGQIVCDKTQKIRSVKINKNFRLVYAWCGNRQVITTEGQKINLKTITDCIIDSLAQETIISFDQWVKRFGDILFPIARMIFEKNIARFQSGRSIAEVLFLSYFNGYPYVAEIAIRHDGVNILRPEIKCSIAPAEFGIFSGSEIAHKEFGGCNENARTLSDFANEAKRYIEICFKYQDVDADAAAIGGHIHIGEFTPNWFRWREQPL